MHCIQKTCGGDLKPGLQLSEGQDAWLHLQGARQQVILSQEETVVKAETHVLGQQIGSPTREKAEDKVQNWPSPQQVGQPTRKTRKSPAT